MLCKKTYLRNWPAAAMETRGPRRGKRERNAERKGHADGGLVEDEVGWVGFGLDWIGLD